VSSTHLPPPFAIFASVASDDLGTVACAFWRRGYGGPLPPLTLWDIDSVSVSDLKDWAPKLPLRLAEIGRELTPPSPPPNPRRAPAPPTPPTGTIFALASISTALSMNRVDCALLPQKMELMIPTGQLELKAAVLISGGQVSFSPAVEQKVHRHPYNAVLHRPLGAPMPAPALAFTIGVLLALATGF
jgi:hypothetical protein